MPGPASLTRIVSSCGAAPPSTSNVDSPAARVDEGVARDLGDRRRDAASVRSRRSRAAPAIWRARWRANTTSCSSRNGTDASSDVIGRLSRPLSRPRHRHVVAAALEIAIEHGRDDAGMALPETRVRVERPVRRQAVGVQHDAATSGVHGYWNSRNLPHLVAERSRSSDTTPCGSVGPTIDAAMLPMPANAHDAGARVEQRHDRGGRAARVTQRRDASPRAPRPACRGRVRTDRHARSRRRRRGAWTRGRGRRRRRRSGAAIGRDRPRRRRRRSRPPGRPRRRRSSNDSRIGQSGRAIAAHAREDRPCRRRAASRCRSRRRAGERRRARCPASRSVE